MQLSSTNVLLSLSLIFSLVSHAFAANTTTVACNNSPSLCSRAYNNVTQLGAHDSPFLRDASTDYSDSGDQFYSSTVQLSAGVRLLTGQIYQANSTSSLHLCHTSCALLDAGLLSTWLAGIKTWLDDNTYDVVTILLVNSDNVEASVIASSFETANITDYAYTPTSAVAPPTAGTWPTLETLINNGTRLMVFVATLPSTSTAAPYLMNEFTYIFENPYDYTNLTSFSCLPQRPTAVSGSISEALDADLMPLMNHFVYETELLNIEVPDIADIAITNAPLGSTNSSTGSLGKVAQSCTQAYGKAPTFLLVDFFNVGPAIDTVDTLNGVTDIVGRTSVSTSAKAVATSKAAGGVSISWTKFLPTSAAIALAIYFM